MNPETARLLRQYDLQRYLLFAILVAGKSATFARTRLERLLPPTELLELPFEHLQDSVDLGTLGRELRRAKTGNYARLEKAIPALLTLDLETCGIAELEAVPGIGPKTARFWLTYARGEDGHAILDVHVLRALRAMGYDAPRATPAQPAYAVWERVFLAECRARGLSPRQFDTQIWEAAAGEVGNGTGGFAETAPRAPGTAAVCA